MLTVKQFKEIISGMPDDYSILMENSQNHGRYDFNIEINNKSKFVNLKLTES